MVQEGKKRVEKSAPTKKAPAKYPAGTHKKGASLAESEALGAVTAEQHHRMIAEVSYFIAEQREFVSGPPLEDWVAVEAEIDNRLLQITG